MRVLALVHHADAGVGVFGAEIARRGHEVEEWEPSAAAGLPRPLADYGAVIAFGGGMQVDEEDRYPWLRTAFGVMRETLDSGTPTLGVCLGAQVLARAAGGDVGPAARPEWGWDVVELTGEAGDDPLFAGLPPALDVLQWHSYAFTLPPGGVPLARSPVCLQAFRAGSAAWGVQWHPEVTGESVLLWGERYPPAPGGVTVDVDLGALGVLVRERIARTNAEGRELCARFLRIAEDGGAAASA
jgi:GMP synthase-like glutamine amidotransferase